MGQGVCVRGELAKRLNRVTIEKSNHSQPQGKECGSERAQVTHMIPESGRSMPDQGEAHGNVRGGPKGF